VAVTDRQGPLHDAPGGDPAVASVLAAMVKAAPVGLAAINVEGQIVDVNPAFGRLVGRDPAELVASRSTSLWHPTSHAKAERTLRGLLCGDVDGVQTEQALRHANGSSISVTISMSLLRSDLGQPALAVLAIEDLTERRTAEVEERHAQKLEAVGRLAAGIAHEINTPIQFIGDNVRFLGEAFNDTVTLLRSYESALTDESGEMPWVERRQILTELTEAADLGYFTEEVPRALAQTLEGVERVAGIVRAMKAFGHPDGGEPAPADLNDAVTNTVMVARNETKYVAEVECDLGDIPPVICFVGDINQVILNLVVNAAHAIADVSDAGHDRGLITIRTTQQGDDVILSVSDTGCGIPPDVADRVFDPFFTTKEVGRGTGQGLALVRSIVERHGGSVTFDSSPGRGTTFSVRLPVDGPGRAR
jgi:PAS domain S-box-containing protein